MSESLLLDRCQLESRLVSQATATWDNGVQNIPEFERKQVLLLCRELPGHLRQAQNALWDKIKARQVFDFQRVGEEFLAVVEESIALTRKLADRFQNGALGAVLTELEQLQTEHQERWPWFSQKDVDEAREASARGETMELTDAFAQIAGVSREQFLEMVKAHEQRKREKGWE